MHGFSMALAQELATKVHGQHREPRYIGTDMVKAIRPDVLEKIVATVPVKRLGNPSEIASIIAWLASEEGGYATGADFSVNGGRTWLIWGRPWENKTRNAGFFIGMRSRGRRGCLRTFLRWTQTTGREVNAFVMLWHGFCIHNAVVIA